MIKIPAIVCLTIWLLPAGIKADNPENQVVSNDSLSLEILIEEIIKNHPSVKEAEETLKNADARISLARTGYYPVIDASAGFSNIGPVLKIDIPQIGEMQLFPENNYSGAVNYRQIIYDFGRTRQNVKLETGNKTISTQTLELVKQKMSLAAINGYYSILYLQEAVKIKNEQLATLEEHLRYIRAMQATGSATDYQILSTEVRISAAQSQKTDLLYSLTVQQAYMGALIGIEKFKRPVMKDLGIELPLINTGSLQQYALLHRGEILISKENASLAELQYQLLRTANKPLISMTMAGGVKNGYQPDLNTLRANYSAAFGISIPIFDGMKTRYKLRQAQSVINNAGYETENIRRSIISEIQEAQSYLESAAQKISQSALQFEQAKKAYELAGISFRAGTITNLEVLDANTAVSESRLILLKSRIDYAAGVYRLKAALGEKLY
ncbi:MAG TPA: TolC family protein [Bacteroidales bacterium]|nr:TolC family protein [Bacteroidales bacterium]HNR41128.1 TolC family protein [Bacteroidales bacterium]HPM17521.1 TolC family protein [Bacteroidales bacterium]